MDTRVFVRIRPLAEKGGHAEGEGVAKSDTRALVGRYRHTQYAVSIFQGKQ